MSGRSRSGAWSASQRIHGILHPDGNKPGLRGECSPFFQKLYNANSREAAVGPLNSKRARLILRGRGDISESEKRCILWEN